MIRIASFNVENLFSRPKALNPLDWSYGKNILEAYSEVNSLFQKENYTDADRKKMRDLLVELDIYYVNSKGAIRKKYSSSPKWAWLRKNRGKFDRQPRDSTKNIEITATGRDSWIGWVELAKTPVNEKTTQLTAKVIKDVDADLIGIVEAEDRPSLKRFNKDMLGNQYDHVMLIDGNDTRGIDVAVLTKKNFEIENIVSNVDLEDSTGIIFSRDCPQYKIKTPSGESIHVLVNHFKSQSGGGGTKRERQAKALRKIAKKLVDAGEKVVALGDFNEGPKSGSDKAENLSTLYTSTSPLVDCYLQPQFDTGERPGSYDSCGLSNRLDYIFISKNLLPKLSSGGIFRKGLWGKRKTRPDKWETYPEMKSGKEQASDHAALWIELDIV